MVDKYKYEFKNLLELSYIDLRNKFTGSILGVLWAFLKPIITLFVFIFVFEVGFKSVPIEGVPFSLWLVSGMIPWFYIIDAWIGASYSLLEYNYLIKKIQYNPYKIPLIKIISNFFVHIAFIVFLLIFAIVTTGFHFSYLGIVYLLLVILIFLISISLITAAIIPFLADVKSLLDVIIQFLFWLTPIIWSANDILPGFEWVVKYNPLAYIMECYRNVFVYHQNVLLTENGVYFWMETLILLYLGITLFERLKKHFSDVI